MLILWQFSHFCFRHSKLDGLRAVSFVRVARENTDHSRMCRRQNPGDNELWTVYMSGGGSMLGANLHVFNTILMVIRRAEGGFRATRSPTNTWNEWTERKSFGVHDRFFFVFLFIRIIRLSVHLIRISTSLAWFTWLDKYIYIYSPLMPPVAPYRICDTIARDTPALAIESNGFDSTWGFKMKCSVKQLLSNR